MKKLTSEQRAIFRLVREAAAVNPFTPERTALDRAIGGAGPADGALPRVIARVRAEAAALEAAGGAAVASYGTEDRTLVRTLLLFDLYHARIPDFDAHILRQAEAGLEPVEIPFADETLVSLRRVGFTAEEALRGFASFFQLRRAFHFIDRALIGRSASMRQFRAQLWNNIFTHDFLAYEARLWNRMEDFSTLLLGETGTGKGAAAAAIGRSGFIPFEPKTRRFAESFTGIFIAANLSQFAETLIESELFGHRKGAFTGAVEAHEGVFGLCRANGAIFLDEIGEVSVPVQIKLLRVLQERTYAPVGSHEERRFAGRVIAATNGPLDDLRRAGRFRDDFYYRLCSDQVVVPPLRLRLREAPEELRDLIAHILRRMCDAPDAELADAIHARLLGGGAAGYAWPGNVRELEQAVRRILLTGSFAAPVGPIPASADSSARLATDLDAGGLDARALLARYCRLLYERSGNYGEVARRTGLDRRTVRKHVRAGDGAGD